MVGCRMYRSPYPEKRSVVMVRVDSVPRHRNIARVSLPEYNNIQGILSFSNLEHSEVVKGQMEPALVSRLFQHSFHCRNCRFRVSAVYPSRVFRVLRCRFAVRRTLSIRLTLQGVSNEDKYACDVKFTKSLHLRSIMQHVAQTRGSSLKEIYKSVGWPSYDDVMNPFSDFRRTLLPSGPLRDALEHTTHLMPYESWRIADRQVLRSRALIDEYGYCFVVALTRQYEALLKIRGRLPVDEFLSVQDFINKLPRKLVNESGITDLRHAVDTLIASTLDLQSSISTGGKLRGSEECLASKQGSVIRMRPLLNKQVGQGWWAEFKDESRHISDKGRTAHGRRRSL